MANKTCIILPFEWRPPSPVKPFQNFRSGPDIVSNRLRFSRFILLFFDLFTDLSSNSYSTTAFVLSTVDYFAEREIRITSRTERNSASHTLFIMEIRKPLIIFITRDRCKQSDFSTIHANRRVDFSLNACRPSE